MARPSSLMLLTHVAKNDYLQTWQNIDNKKSTHEVNAE
jgi:hypothetical protein